LSLPPLTGLGYLAQDSFSSEKPIGEEEGQRGLDVLDANDYFLDFFGLLWGVTSQSLMSFKMTVFIGPGT